MEKQNFSILLTIIGLLHFSHGCSIEGVNWFVPETKEILDTERGIIFHKSTQNIQAISNVRQGEGLNEGPYIIATLKDSLLIIETDTAFENYEKIETETTLRYTITLTCTDSTTRNLIFIIEVTDTNNNDPVFLPTSNYEFTITPPVPPGFVVTSCLNDILVRDIDLTTYSIDFKIEGSDLFEISFDPSSKVAKEFKATLKTTNLIRSLAEPVKLTVTATDVDLTEGPPRTATATVVIAADSQFQFPDEPIFSQPFYLATYKSNNDLILQDKIFLRQGYDDLVKFTFGGDHSEYFDFVVNQNSISFNMKAPIPIELYDERQIYLIVKATREHTSGATATVIVKLPEDTSLEFENAIYEGSIIDNVLQLSDLKLKQGYEGFNITVDIESEYAFRASVESNVIKISMDPLATDVIENNNFINLQITASNNRSTAVTVVMLEIIKNDYTTPLFEYNFYSGNYSTEIGLTLQQIILTQGFDETVKITLEGEHSKYFQTKQDGSRITLTSSTIPTDIFDERNIMITILASKPRTVGAHATVNIELPSARYLDFEKNIYEGTIENNNLILSNIVLMDGYTSDVNFILEGEFVTYFSIKQQQNVVTIEIEKVIPENVVSENDILVLTLNAIGTNAFPTSTSIVLKIIKDDDQTPMFSENLYSLKYENDELSLGNITLVQGFDDTVTFELIGEHKEYFAIEPSLNIIKLLLKSSIPEDVIFNNKIIILNVVAQKPRTVGANAAVYITFPQEMIEPTVMSFTLNAYSGFIKGSSLTVDDIVLEPGYTPQTEFILNGEYSEYFTLHNSINVVKLIPASGKSLEDLKENNVIILEVKATRERAISAVTVVVIDILKTVIVPPVFEKAFYTGAYTISKGLLFDEQITLELGFDSTVTFGLEEEFSKWFTLEQSESSVTLKVKDTNPIPEEILENNLHLFFTVIASKPGAVTGRAVIYIDLPKEETAPIILQFEKRQYLGIIENRALELEIIRLIDADISFVHFNITGDYASYFKIAKSSDFIQINLLEPPSEMIDDNDFVILTLEASELGAISGHTTIVVEIVKDGVQIKKPIFNEIYYTGEHSQESELIFPTSITLIQGYDETVSFELKDDDSQWFSLVQNVPNTLTLKIKNDSINDITGRSHLIFTVAAHKANSTSAHAAIVISLIDNSNVRILKFEQSSYLGNLENEMLEIEEIGLLSGITSTMEFIIIGDYASYFSISKQVDSVQINLVEFSTELTDTNDLIILNLKVSEPGAVSGHTTIVVNIVKNEENNTVTPVFSEAYYTGQYSKENGLVFLSVITLIQGYDETVTLTLDNDDSKAFALVKNGLNNFTLILDGGLSEEVHKNYFLFTVIADKPSTNNGQAAIVISLTEPPENEDVSFDRILYNGKLENGVLSHEEINVSGFEGTNIQIKGEHSALFTSELSNGVVKIKTSGADFPSNLNYISLELQAASANAILLIEVSFSEKGDVSFDRILYNGKLENGVLSHDEINVSGFEGTNIQIKGEHSALFTSELSNGVVKIKTSGADFPTNLNYISLELQAASANAILLIDVSFSENSQPIVSFKSQSYFLWADIEQTGVVGAVEATADNGEAVIYSLSEHIESQININSNGEIYLTSAFDKGVYKFNAVATSVQSQVQATVPVLLRVNTLPECSNEVGLSPLIILERLEEEPHRNLVILNQTEHKGCKYLLTNVFPKDQSWLYVDSDGLHTKAIDREDTSIAFMTLSQIQVELTLDCDRDEVPTFAKRSLGTGDESDLYSYDDGPNKWVLTDTILFNARRSFVNLIVRDINDNSPIFLGKGNEPIYVGYPVSELEGTVLPRSLAELKATDADIGENAAITYSSLEDNLAVSPSTGLVHVRNNAQLENDSRLTIYAIDQNGKGRSGTIDIVVKLLDKNQIIVLTVKDAFLEDEVDVVNELSIAVGYEIKVLRAVVIPNNNEDLSRRNRDVDSNSQASLQLYAYGLLESEPVDINQLTRDINNINIATVNIATIVSLEDHLEGLEICTAPARDTGLLAATIILAVLLFIAIVAIAVKFLLKWKTFKNYNQFSNRNSSVSQSSSPNLPKIEVVPKLRPDIDEIKRTERRLQEMLETPVENVPTRQAGDNVKPPIETVHETRVNISSTDAQIPIVIQSIDKLKDKTDESDDNDEFGEVTKPRKSVVTFNENVEKIIHIEDVPDDNSSENNFEISKF